MRKSIFVKSVTIQSREKYQSIPKIVKKFENIKALSQNINGRTI